MALDLGYAYRLKEFTSDLVRPSNQGVFDATHVVSAELRYQLSPAAAVTVGFQGASQWSSNAESRDFFNTNSSVGLQCRF